MPSHGSFGSRRVAWGSLLWLVCAACAGPDAESEADGGEEGAIGIRLQTLLSDGTDVAALRVDATPSPCDDGLTGQARSQTIALDPERVFPGEIPRAISFTRLEGSHLVATSLLLLEPGCYRVQVSPLDEAGEASADCAVSSREVRVSPTFTPHLEMLVQCNAQGPGAVDLTAVLNHPPVIEDVTFVEPQLFCESTKICARASDPDGDEVELVLQASRCKVVMSEERLPGERCWRVGLCHEPGRQYLVLTVFDHMNGPHGSSPRIEDYQTYLGDPHESRAQLSFSAISTYRWMWPDRDGDGAGDRTQRRAPFCAGDDTTGLVDNADDCNDDDPDVSWCN